MASLLGRVTFSPIITGGLLYLLTKAPEQYRLPVIAFLESKLSTISIERLLVGIKTLCVLGIVRQVNIKLNSLAFTHWRMNARKDRWHWNSEVAIVTGGSLGIGKGTVASLYSKGMKVAIFDIVEPPMEFGGSENIPVFP
jgi:all-trans-retinol dehydrogenase (NAD+)